jgi:hypothetical protein
MRSSPWADGEWRACWAERCHARRRVGERSGGAGTPRGGPAPPAPGPRRPRSRPARGTRPRADPPAPSHRRPAPGRGAPAAVAPGGGWSRAPPRLWHRAPGAASVGVWQVMSRGRDPSQGRPPPEGVHVAYPLLQSPFIPRSLRVWEGGYLREASSVTPVSSWYSSAVNRKEAACTFSSRCLIEEVPGIGSMTGDRFNSQASATWLGVFW